VFVLNYYNINFLNIQDKHYRLYTKERMNDRTSETLCMELLLTIISMRI